MSQRFSLEEGDRVQIVEMIGRPLRGSCRVVVRNLAGAPVVIENEPLLDDGTPMPTLFWLVDPALNRAVGRLEAEGGVNRVEAELGDLVLDELHQRHAKLRERLMPLGHEGPAPSGGVGGTRRGVKCLHAHLAAGLVDPDPVGDWVLERLGEDEELADYLDGLVLLAREGATDGL
ncbi:MAG: DUF501 domain-containing protein [Actinomycetes bacterium]